MQNVNRNVPVFIHVCAQMGLTDPFLNRDEYGNGSPVWEDCDEYRALGEVTWFKFTEDDEGNERVAIHIRTCNSHGFLSDDVDMFKICLSKKLGW